MTTRPLSAVVLALLACVTNVTAQISPIARFHHDRWPSGEFLAGESVASLGQSADGYLWLGTPNALWRFDGVRFRRMTARGVAFTQRVPLPVVRFDDDRQRLWFAAISSGPLIYERGRVTRLARRDTASIPGPYDLARTTDGRIWAMVALRLCEWKDGRYAETAIAGLPRDGITAIVGDSIGGLYVGHTSGFVYRVTTRGVDTVLASTSFGRVETIFPEPHGRLWVLAGDGIWLRDSLSLKKVGSTASMGSIVSLARDGDGGAWAASHVSGLWHFDAAGNFVEHIHADSLAFRPPRAVFVDREKSVWVGTDHGLERFQPTPFQFAGLTGAQVGGSQSSAIWLDDHTFASVGSSLARIALVTDTVADVGPALRAAGTLTALSGAGGQRIAADGSGGVWYMAGLTAHHSTKRGTVGYPIPDSSRVPIFHDLVQTSAGDVLALTTSGIHQLGPNGWRRWISNPPVAPSVFPRRWSAGHFTVDAQGYPWIFGTGNVYRLENQQVVLFDKARGLTDMPAVAAAQDTGGTLWIIAMRGTVLRLRNDTIAVARPPTDTAYATVYAAIADGNGSLWIDHSDHVVRIATSELHAVADGKSSTVISTRYGPRDGVRGEALLRAGRAIRLQADGSLWFARDHGVLMASLSALPPIAPVRARIEGTQLDDGEFTPDDSAAVVPAVGGRLQIYYTSTSLRLPDRLRFRYMLDGVDRTWREVSGEERAAIYPTLAPGSYRFRLQASTDGTWSADESVMIIRKLPRWFQTWWAFTLAGIALALVGAGAVAARAAQRQHALELRHATMMEERTRVARDLHDTLLQGFAAITLQLDQVRLNIINAPAVAEAKLGRLLDQADHTLTTARRAVWDLRAPELEAHGLAKAVEASLVRMLDGRSSLTYVCAGNARPLPSGVEGAIFYIALEAAANAVTHGRASAINVTLKYSTSGVELAVADNGAGFDVHARANSDRPHLGMAGMRERAAQIGAEFAIVSKPGTGTTVELRHKVNT